MPIGFIGLGSMGMSICNRMLCAGYMVKVRPPARTQASKGADRRKLTAPMTPRGGGRAQACEIRQEAIEMLRKTGASIVDSPSRAAEGVNLLV